MPTHGGSIKFSPGGGGMFRSIGHIKTMSRFFSPQLILQKSNGYFQRKLSFSEVPGGFGGGGGGGGLFPLETHITCDFPGGPDPISLYLEDHIFF